jgi:SAM-dependent methyltransferase
MEPSLIAESERLARSWTQHEADWLRDYLVRDVEDPRINLQSIFTRHFLLRALFGERFQWLMEQECRFAACMNWFSAMARRLTEPEELQAIQNALSRGLDNAEGISIPGFLVHTFASLPVTTGDTRIPNYIEALLSGTRFNSGRAELDPQSLDTFRFLWNASLTPREGGPILSTQLLSVLEPACGSANDYRFLHAYGLTRFLDYTGVDICAKNVENARAQFPQARFEMGNVFELSMPDQAFDLCFVHDLFEHLSLEGLDIAIREVCRVTRRGLCVGFFNLDEIPEHIVRPTEEYHWNTLSLSRMKQAFASYGFTARVLNVGAFLRQHFGAEETHNANACTLILWRTA